MRCHHPVWLPNLSEPGRLVAYVSTREALCNAFADAAAPKLQLRQLTHIITVLCHV
jgi:hypothetical protein